MSDAPLIDVHKLEAWYGRRRILHGVDFRVEAGEIRVIMGGSGSGKSTLLRHLLGLRRPEGGTVRLLGVDIGLLRARDDDPLGEAIDAGVGILLGAVPALPDPTGMSDVRHTVDAVRSLWSRVGFGADRMREVAAVTPTCGLAGAGEAAARQAMRVCREAAKALSEEGS